jgi:hypothetical protein
MRIVPGLLETRLHVAKRMREIAATSEDPAEIEAAVAYAKKLERMAQNEPTAFLAWDQRGPPTGPASFQVLA